MLGEIMYHNNNPYRVLRRIAEHNFTFKNKLEMKAVEMYRDHIKANHVLKDPTHFIFVEKIEEAQIIE
jgi:hypothetical protein